MLRRLLSLMVGCASLAHAVCPIVDDTADTGPNTLRDCLAQAQASGLRTRITFSVSGTIALSTPLPQLASPLEIDGTSAAVVVDGSALMDANVFDVAGNDTVLRGLTLRGVTGAGFGSGAAVLVRPGVTGTVITGCTLQDVRGEGIFLGGDNEDSHLVGNTITRTGSCGIFFDQDTVCGVRREVRGNVISNVGKLLDCGGIYVAGARCVDVLENTISDFANNGVKVSRGTSSEVVVRGNRISGGKGAAIGVYGGAHASQFVFNVLEGSDGTGLSLGDVGTTDNLVAGNRVRATLPHAGGSRGWGIHLYDGAERTRVFHNTVFGNSGDGIVVEMPLRTSRFENNLVASNGGVGFRIAPDAGVSMGHNLTFGNDGGAYADFNPDPGAISCDPQLDPAGAPACSACVLDRGEDLGAEQPDLTPPADGLRFFGANPEPGAVELMGCVVPDAGVVVDAGSPGDAGVAADAGTEEPDVGMPSAQRLGVGCGCGALAPPWILLVAALAPSLRRRSRAALR